MTALDALHLAWLVAVLAPLAACVLFARQGREELARPPAAAAEPLVPPLTVAPWLRSGRRTGSRAGPDEQRLDVSHGAQRAPRLRIGRTGGPMAWRDGEVRVAFEDARFTVLCAGRDADLVVRVAAALPRASLERLLLDGDARWLEVDPTEVAMVRPPRAWPLVEPRPAFQALDELAVVVERLGRCPALRITGRPTALRCAYCHDDLDPAAPPCPGCATRLHTDCRAEVGCPTPGCAARRDASARRAALRPAG